MRGQSKYPRLTTIPNPPPPSSARTYVFLPHRAIVRESRIAGVRISETIRGSEPATLELTLGLQNTRKVDP